MLKLLLLLVFIATVVAFAPSYKKSSASTALSVELDRRQAVGAATSIAGLSFLAKPSFAAQEPGSDPDHPIVVIGAGGKSGSLATQILANKNFYTRAVTRSGRTILDSKYVTSAAADVKEDMQQAVKGAAGVIFAASASGKDKGGDPAHVDYLGVVQTAKACLAQKVPKLVVVSAATATRPDSAGFKATNFFVKYVYGDKIMDYKIAGEAAMRDLYASSSDCHYTVIRPGGLSDGASQGPGLVHVSQGDVYASEVTRQDVAEVAVASILAGSATDDVTFELNQIKGLGKTLKTLPDLDAKLVHAGAATYEGLLQGLLTDSEIKKEYPDLINDFRGSGIEPVASLV